MRLFVAIAVFLPVLLNADKLKRMSPEEMGLLALERSEQVTSLELEVLSQKANVEQAGVYKNPSVSFSLGKRIDNGDSGPAYQIGVSQPFLFPGKRKLKEKTNIEEVRSSKERLKQQKLNIYYDVLLLAYDYFISIEREKHARERMKRFKILDKFFRSRPFPSLKNKLSKMVIANRLRILKAELTGIQNEKQIAWENLNLYLSLSEKIVPDVGLFIKLPKLSFDVLLDASLKNSSYLKELESKVRQFSLLAKLAEKEVYPDISLKGYYSRQSGGGEEINYGAGVSIPIPVWNRNKGKYRAYDFKSSAFLEKLKFEKKQLIQKFQIYKSKFITAEKKVGSLPGSLMKGAHKQLQYADYTFRRGLIGFAEFLNVEEEHDVIHEEILEVHREYALFRIKLYYLSGEILTVFPKGVFDV